MKTPIVLFIFKRPDEARKVLDVIRQARPEKLFIVADGPRYARPDEKVKCQETRRIVELIDWKTELFKNFSKDNLGLKKRFTTGLNWVFKHVESAIILEDDCIPDISFFHFCESMLSRYCDDERIFSITGHNHLGEWKTGNHNYFFSNYFDCWGWATWKRVWEKYDSDMSDWPKPEVQEKIRQVIADDAQFFNRCRVLDASYSGEINSWAYPFFMMSLYHNGLTVTPSVNLIRNIGFGPDSSNTTNRKDLRKDVKQFSLLPPFIPPENIVADREYDFRRYKKVWRKTFTRKVLDKLKGASFLKLKRQ